MNMVWCGRAFGQCTSIYHERVGFERLTDDVLVRNALDWKAGCF